MEIEEIEHNLWALASYVSRSPEGLVWRRERPAPGSAAAGSAVRRAQRSSLDEERPYCYPPSVDRDLGVTDGSAIDHLAFSYTDIDPVFERMEEAGAEIVRPIRFSQEHGHRSFFARAPDGLLVEIVEARPIPEGLWR